MPSIDQMTLLPAAEPHPRRFLAQSLPVRPQAIPAISCPERDYRAWQTWRDVGEACREMPVVTMGQAWRETDEEALAPAAVAVAHHQDELIIYAEMADVDIFNPVREHGAHAYQRGDAFEIFLRAEGAENYFEHHITPANFTLQLSFPTLTAFGEHCSADPDWAKPLMTAIPVPSRVLAQPEIETWRVLAIVPLALIVPARKTVPKEWRFSFCRYDHTHGREKPVLSSTTPYRFANFHHQEMWGRLTLE
jgi:hypothetical protein